MTVEQLISTITSANEALMEITYEQACKAYQVSTILFNNIRNKSDALYFFTAMNLMNAYVKKPYADEYLKKNYRFKTYVAKALEQVISNIHDISVYLDKNIAYVSIDGLQFSFHNVRPTKALEEYIESPKNKKQEWTGIRLQPAAGMIFDWAENYGKSDRKKFTMNY